MQSDNPDLALAAFSGPFELRDQQDSRVFLDVIAGENTRSDVLAQAIESINGCADNELLAVIAEQTDKQTLRWQPDYMHLHDESYPFKDFIAMPNACAGWKKWIEERGGNVTTGSVAAAKLNELTGQNFGTDKNKCQQWLQRQAK